MGDLIKVDTGRRPPAGNKEPPRMSVHMNICTRALSHTHVHLAALNVAKARKSPKQMLLKTDGQSGPFSFSHTDFPSGGAQPNCISFNNKHMIRPNDVIAAIASTC